MSTSYRSLTPVRFAELFDGRLKDAGIHEHQSKEEQTSNHKCLTDGRNFLWVRCDQDRLVTTFARYGLNAPQRILRAIADKFDVDIVSEYEPEFWGYETTEEWDAAWNAMAQKDEKDFYQEVVKFIREESHDIRSGTIGMIKAEITKGRRADLIKAVDAVVVKLTDQQLDFVRMAATRKVKRRWSSHHVTRQGKGT
jgi:hypothetical protein